MPDVSGTARACERQSDLCYAERRIRARARGSDNFTARVRLLYAVAAGIVVTGASSGPRVSDAAARRQGVPRSIVVRDVKSFVEGARGLPGTRTLRFQGARAFRFPDARAFMFPGAPPS